MGVGVFDEAGAADDILRASGGAGGSRRPKVGKRGRQVTGEGEIIGVNSGGGSWYTNGDGKKVSLPLTLTSENQLS